MASIIADKKFEKKYRAMTDANEVVIPKTSAWFLETFPIGIGLKQVLFIKASKSDSYHIFKAPAAPAPKVTAISDKAAVKKSTWLGAINNPTTQVKITSDITRGFINWKKLFNEITELIPLMFECCNLDSRLI